MSTREAGVHEQLAEDIGCPGCASIGREKLRKMEENKSPRLRDPTLACRTPDELFICGVVFSCKYKNSTCGTLGGRYCLPVHPK